MNEEKKRLLREMIAFSKVEGHLQKKDYEFLFLMANEFNIEKGGFNDLFNQELPVMPIKNESVRIQQFYRLALLLNNDANTNAKEASAIRQIAVRMGLNPEAANRVQKKIVKAPATTIPKEVLLRIFKEERN